MSIDIRCYCTTELSDLKIKLDCLRRKYNHIFNDVYYMFEPEMVLSHQDIDIIDDRIKKYIQSLQYYLRKSLG